MKDDAIGPALRINRVEGRMVKGQVIRAADRVADARADYDA